MLAVVYIRVSTEDQAREGYSLEVQEERCRQRARDLGCDRVEVYSDDVTGEILNRPALMAVLDRIKQGGVEYFICY
ncbi:MAG: recombinase family protein, partial [Firmicutes bacterium]|nr:recombinase family protein [Bacillota bacterium]